MHFVNTTLVKKKRRKKKVKLKKKKLKKKGREGGRQTPKQKLKEPVEKQKNIHGAQQCDTTGKRMKLKKRNEERQVMNKCIMGHPQQLELIAAYLGDG